MPLFGPPNVEKLKAKGNIKGLIKALGYREDDQVRQAATEALVEIGELAAGPLIGLLQTSDGLQTRIAAITTLGRIGDPRAIEPFLAILNQSRQLLDERHAILTALGEIGDPRAVEPLLKASRSGTGRNIAQAMKSLIAIGEPAIKPLRNVLLRASWSERKKALEALEQMGWRPDTPQEQAIWLVAKGEWEKCVELGEPAADALVAALGSSLSAPHAIPALIAIGEPSVPALINAIPAALGQRYGDQFKHIATVLGRIGDARAVNPLIRVLTQTGNRYAADALGAIGDPRAVPALRSLLDSRDRYLVNTVKRILKSFSLNPRVIEPLLVDLASNNWLKCRQAIEELDSLGWEPGQDKHGLNYWVAKERWITCTEFGEAALERLLYVHDHWTLDGNSRASLLMALGRIGSERVVSRLITVLASGGSRIGHRGDAAMALGLTGNPRAIPPLIGLLTDNSHYIRKNAANALIALYRSGNLNDEHKQQILTQRTIIEAPHTDSSDCHEDRGIGVTFPV